MAVCRLSGAANTSPSLGEGAKSPFRLWLAGPSISSTTRYSTGSSTAGSAGISFLPKQLARMARCGARVTQLCTT